MLNRTFKSVAVVAVLAAHVGCTSLQPLPKTCNGGPCVASLSAGDNIVVTTQNRSEIALTVKTSDAGQLVGVTKGAPTRPVTLPASDIVDVQKREFSAGRTAGLVAAIAVVIGVAVAISVGKGLGSAVVKAASGGAA